jgi:hypothetical protein
VRTRIPVDVEAGGNEISGEVGDVSLDGLWFPTTVRVSEQTPCRVTIHLDEAFTIRADGVVARSEPDGFAVHFLELLELESYEHLRNLILNNAVDPAQVEQEFDSHLGLRRVDPALPPPE